MCGKLKLNNFIICQTARLIHAGYSWFTWIFILIKNLNRYTFNMLILPTIATLPTCLNQDDVCFCHTHFITYFQFLSFCLSDLTNWGWLKRIERPFHLRKRDLVTCEQQSHAASLTGAHTPKVKWNNVSNPFNLYDKSAHRPPLGST